MIKNLLREAFILKNKGYYKHAIEAFYKALEYDNSSYELLLELAECYYYMNDEERALGYIDQILDADPMNIDSLNLLKNIFIKKNALKEAEQTAKNIYSITNNINDLTEILTLLNKQGKYSEVFNYNYNDENYQILYEKAFANLHLNKLKEAENLINKALLANDSGKNHLLKSKILYKMNKKDEAAKILEPLAIENNNADFLNFLGLIKQYKQEYKTAISYFINAQKIEPNNSEYYYNCASTYFKSGDLQQAKKYYNLAISLAPDNQNYHFALANLYYSERYYKRALEELNYDFFEAKLLKTIILYDTGYLVLAKKELDKLIQEQPENFIVLDYKKRIEQELGI